jgi:hypothetical protein
MPGPQDVGGEPAGTIDRSEHTLTPFELSVDALVRRLVLQTNPVISIDEMRRMMETVTPLEYRSMRYYERWLRALKDLVVEKGMLTPDQIDEHIHALKTRPPPDRQIEQD